MKGLPLKLSPKKSRAIAALLEEKTIQKAAASVGIGETTLHRWLSDEDFQTVYRGAKKRIVSHAISRLQNATGEAVDALTEILRDKDKPPSTRVTASKAILEFAMKAVELEDLQARVDEIENTLERQRHNQ
ncbi:hypothetical protein ACFL0H_00285 [Thermodesulfobacteriota bacterium]